MSVESRDSEAMSHVDAAWLRMDSPTNPMVITSTLLFSGAVPFEAFERLVRDRLLACHPRFTQRVVDLGVPLVAPRWQTIANFDLRLHLHHRRLPAPADHGALADLVSDLVSTPLPRDRPLWQAYVVDDVAGDTALIVRIHHAVGDGVALVRVLMSLCDDSEARPKTVGQKRPRATGAAALSKALAAQTATLGRLLLLPPDPPTPLSGPLGLEKRVAWSRPFELAAVRSVAEQVEGKLNDVLQAAVAGGIHRYLHARGALPDGVDLRTMVPVFLRDEDHGLGNHFGLVFLDLPVTNRDARERVRAVKQRMDQIKSAEDATVAFALLDALGVGSHALEHIALEVFTRKATSVTTNVPGPPERARFAGHTLDSLLVWAPTSGHIGVGFTLLSYAGEVRLGVATDVRLVPDPAELVAAFESDLSELLQR